MENSLSVIEKEILDFTSRKLSWLIENWSRLEKYKSLSEYDLDENSKQISRDFNVRFENYSYSINYLETGNFTPYFGLCYCFLNNLPASFRRKMFSKYPNYSCIVAYPLSGGKEEYKFMIENELPFTYNPERLEFAKFCLGYINEHLEII